jgi:hypothetical protein
MAIRRLTRSANTPAPPAGDFQIIIQDGYPRLRDPNGNVMRIRPEPGTPVNPAPATATLNPAGDNNDILIASTDPAIQAAEILIDDDVDRTGLSVTGGASISVVSGDKRVVQVGGTLTDGVNPVVFPLLSELTIEGGDLFWEIGSSEDLPYFVVSGTPFGSWFIGAITETGSAEWSSADEVATPDLVTTWTPVAPATGTPTVTAAPATAAQLIAAINAEEIEGVTAANAPGSDGTGTVAATTANFDPAVTATPGALGDMLFDGDNAYLKTVAGWETLPYEV